jgi:hypothetical protein
MFGCIRTRMIGGRMPRDRKRKAPDFSEARNRVHQIEKAADIFALRPPGKN